LSNGPPKNGRTAEHATGWPSMHGRIGRTQQSAPTTKMNLGRAMPGTDRRSNLPSFCLFTLEPYAPHSLVELLPSVVTVPRALIAETIALIAVLAGRDAASVRDGRPSSRCSASPPIGIRKAIFRTRPPRWLMQNGARISRAGISSPSMAPDRRGRRPRGGPSL